MGLVPTEQAPYGQGSFLMLTVVPNLCYLNRISENYICFNSPMMEQKVVIPFRTIIAINKESSTFGVLANSIAIHTKEKEEVLLLLIF